MHGGGAGCTYPDARRSRSRRWFHHCTFYGFVLCFVSTSMATVYHYGLGWVAPYPFFSAPVLAGTMGGLGLVIGTAGLLALHPGRDETTVDGKQMGMDVGFTVLLFYAALSGLALLAWRTSSAMGPLLMVHLAAVMAIFVTLPYGKFVHAVYRPLALLRYALERRRAIISAAGE